MDAVLNPFSPGAGLSPPELLGRSDVRGISTAQSEDMMRVWSLAFMDSVCYGIIEGK